MNSLNARRTLTKATLMAALSLLVTAVTANAQFNMRGGGFGNLGGSHGFGSNPLGGHNMRSGGPQIRGSRAGTAPGTRAMRKGQPEATSRKGTSKRAISDQKDKGTSRPAISDQKDKSVPESAKTPVFTGKPADVAHNPLHNDGDLGRTHNHQTVVVEKDNQFYERHYYRDDHNVWFWYDNPLPALGDTIVVFLCPADSDDCHLRPRGPIADVPGGPSPGGPIAEGPGDDGGISYAPPEECPDKRLAARHAYSVCLGDSFWHVRTDNYYCCPPNKTIYVEAKDGPSTNQPCGGGVPGAGAGAGAGNNQPAWNRIRSPRPSAMGKTG